MIIFLDIDGVLVTELAWYARINNNRANPKCIAALNHLVERTDAKIVLSSSWRFCGFQEMKRVFEYWGIRGELIDMTPIHMEARGELYVALPRSSEIQAWIDSHEYTGPFVILDDMSSMEHLQGNLLHCEFEDGLTMDRVNGWLESKPREDAA